METTKTTQELMIELIASKDLRISILENNIKMLRDRIEYLEDQREELEADRARFIEVESVVIVPTVLPFGFCTSTL